MLFWFFSISIIYFPPQMQNKYVCINIITLIILEQL